MSSGPVLLIIQTDWLTEWLSNSTTTTKAFFLPEIGCRRHVHLNGERGSGSRWSTLCMLNLSFWLASELASYSCPVFEGQIKFRADWLLQKKFRWERYLRLKYSLFAWAEFDPKALQWNSGSFRSNSLELTLYRLLWWSFRFGCQTAWCPSKLESQTSS
jgi:hypothetical protein